MNTNCPICDNPLKTGETFCPRCGFEVHILPEKKSAEVLEYEKERIKSHIKIWEKVTDNLKTIDELTKKCDELTQKVEKQIEAFVIVAMEEETVDGKILRIVKDVLPIYDGQNTLGRMPKDNPETHQSSILFGAHIEDEHIMIEKSDKNSFLVHSLSGDSYLRNRSNKIINPEELNNGNDIFIGNLVLTFITK